jgi:hypothetical protein
VRPLKCPWYEGTHCGALLPFKLQYTRLEAWSYIPACYHCADKTIDGKWENIKTIIKETKQKIIEKDGGAEKLRNQWYNEECKTAIEEMKRARERWLIKGRRESEQEYHHKRNEAHKLGIRKRYT